HLRNTELLYDARRRGWRLAPAFDLNPMPGDRRESKIWLTRRLWPIVRGSSQSWNCVIFVTFCNN
ncbi:MAG: hypothetical protein RLN96_12055, partial [Pseudomonadales bacterium]